MKRLEYNQSNPGAGETLPEAIYERLQLIKAHKLIKALQTGPFKGIDMTVSFCRLLDCLHRGDYLRSLMSQRKQIGLYDIMR